MQRAKVRSLLRSAGVDLAGFRSAVVDQVRYRLDLDGGPSVMVDRRRYITVPF